MYQLAGVNLPFNSKNEALVKNRLVRVLRKYNFQTYEEYWSFIKAADDSQKQEFISALTTNMTSFFREISHFDWFKKHLKEHFSRHYSIRIWCAASSTGQEPYTIAISVCESLSESQRGHVRILASDIDLEVLKKASLGYYFENEISGLSKDLIFKYFDRMKKNGETVYRVKDFLRSMVQFSQFNLVSEKYEFKRPFDVIFCRNVLIYFDEKTVGSVIEKLSNSLTPSGYLLLGHSESGNVRHRRLTALSKAIFQRKEEHG
ncbi:MAG: protein-glutamate O-methyltransferase CheR [Bdellovibrionales bacterium]|nr:protein-glutamate O-methyltransferase CheR [Bdellovibrionales bacterium]